MTIASEITRIKNNIASAYTALADKGATLPVTQDSANLVTTVESIQNSFTISSLNINDAVRIDNGIMYVNAGYGNSYIDTEYNITFTPEQWQKELIIQIHIKTPSTLSNQWLMGNGSAWNTGIGITINPEVNNAFWVCLGQSDTSKTQTLTGSTIPQTDTEYWVRIYKPNTENLSAPTVLQISTDGINWTTESSISIPNITSNYVTDGDIRLFNDANRLNYFQGGIFFDEDTFISVDGEKVWYLID